MAKESRVNILKTVGEGLDQVYELISKVEDETQTRLKEIINRGSELSQEARKKVEEAVERIKSTPAGERTKALRGEIERILSDGLERILNILNIPSRREIERIVSRLERLERSLGKKARGRKK